MECWMRFWGPALKVKQNICCENIFADKTGGAAGRETFGSFWTWDQSMEPSYNVSKETLPRFSRNFETPFSPKRFFETSLSWKSSCFPRNGVRPRSLCALWEHSSQRSWPPGQLNKMLLIRFCFVKTEKKDQKPHLNSCFVCQTFGRTNILKVGGGEYFSQKKWSRLRHVHRIPNAFHALEQKSPINLLHSWNPRKVVVHICRLQKILKHLSIHCNLEIWRKKAFLGLLLDSSLASDGSLFNISIMSCKCLKWAASPQLNTCVMCYF